MLATLLQKRVKIQPTKTYPKSERTHSSITIWASDRVIISRIALTLIPPSRLFRSHWKNTISAKSQPWSTQQATGSIWSKRQIIASTSIIYSHRRISRIDKRITPWQKCSWNKRNRALSLPRPLMLLRSRKKTLPHSSLIDYITIKMSVRSGRRIFKKNCWTISIKNWLWSPKSTRKVKYFTSRK